MPNTRKKPAATKAAKKRTPPEAKPASGTIAAEEQAFTRSLIVHGQASKRAADGTLPSGATHELVEDAQGEVKAVRRRFSFVK